MPKKYVVELTPEERRDLQAMVRKGKAAANKILHAQILLKSDEADAGPACSDEQIAEACAVAVRTVERTRQRLVERGLGEALAPSHPSEYPSRRKIDGAAEARLVALACTPAPEGRRRWTIRLLADKMVELEVVDSLGRETVRATLKKTNLSLG